MNRGLPTSSKILMKKWHEKDQQIHMQKLKEIKPSIDSHTHPY